MAAANSADAPMPVRTVSRHIGDWVARLGRVWVEGQITEITRRPGMQRVFLTLRDPAADVSLRLSCPRAVADAVVPPLTDGARVVVDAKPEVYLQRGTLQLTVFEIRPVGVGVLLARLERLRQVLAAEGLFDRSHKKPLPLLPRGVGLVTGRSSAAERDVVENATRRWPGVRFVRREVPVQGPAAVTGVIEALTALDASPDVDVIVIARGGGSVEDLLPFSDESLLRAVHRCATPVVSAIGHEQDVPLLDFVADVRCSTPTDAGKRIVPDLAEELARLARARRALDRCVDDRLTREQHLLDGLRSRPALAAPGEGIARRATEVAELLERCRRTIGHALDRHGDDLRHLRARVLSLGPAATLERGYAVLQTESGAVVRAPEDAPPGTPLVAHVARGRLDVTAGRTAVPSSSRG